MGLRRRTGLTTPHSEVHALGSLGAVEGARALDLFAGSGALGIEALSRGAAAAVFVEHDRAARAALEANLTATGLADQAEVVAGDAHRYLERADDHFDLVLLDPPYAFDDWPALFSAFRRSRSSGCMRAGASACTTTRCRRPALGKSFT